MNFGAQVSVAIVNMSSVMHNLSKYSIAFYDVNSKTLAIGINAKNHIMAVDNRLERPNPVVGIFDKYAGGVRKLPQFFQIGHCRFQTNT